MDKKKKEPEREKRIDGELRKASYALHYEIWMFNEMVKSLSSQPPEPGNPQYNALVESFVQHTRNLIEFFYPPNKVHLDTLIAPDFFLDRDQWGKDISEWLDDVRIRANKLLAHLTYDRVLKYKDDKGWEYFEITEHLNSIFAEFLEKVPQDRLGDKLKNYKVLTLKTVELPNILASTGNARLPGITVSRDLFQ